MEKNFRVLNITLWTSLNSRISGWFMSQSLLLFLQSCSHLSDIEEIFFTFEKHQIKWLNFIIVWIASHKNMESFVWIGIYIRMVGFGDHLCEIVPTLKLNLGRFSFCTNSAPLGHVCLSVCLDVCLFAPLCSFFFEASHWPSGHMIISRPLIGPPSLLPLETWKLGNWETW